VCHPTHWTACSGQSQRREHSATLVGTKAYTEGVYATIGLLLRADVGQSFADSITAINRGALRSYSTPGLRRSSVKDQCHEQTEGQHGTQRGANYELVQIHSFPFV
jgi:hypothetical protein